MPTPKRRADRRSAAPQPAPVVDAHAVELHDVGFVYPGTDRPALHKVSLTVDHGEFVYLVGASGSGKSTLLKLLYAEHQASTGRMRVAGTNLRRLRSGQRPAHRRKLGVVFQDYKLLDGRTVAEQVTFALTVLGRRRQAAALVPQVLELVGLAGKESRLVSELSGGEMQRVAIARALATRPVLLIADEPTGNLDPVTSASVLEVLERVNASGTTIVMATHDEQLVDATGHRVVGMAEGRVVRDDRAGGYSAAGEVA